MSDIQLKTSNLLNPMLLSSGYVAETPPGSPEEFISMAHEVNPIPGEAHSSEAVVNSSANLPVAVPSTSQMGPLESRCRRPSGASVSSTLGQMGQSDKIGPPGCLGPGPSLTALTGAASEFIDGDSYYYSAVSTCCR